jgi:PadR family transcriptional regulator, regulatory protein PadR
MQRSIKLLPQVQLAILVALSLKPRHGYEIIQQVEEDSGNLLTLSAGTLYGAIKELRAKKLIKDIASSADDRRRYYELTSKGKKQLDQEIQYFEQTVLLAKKRGVKTNQTTRFAV